MTVTLNHQPIGVRLVSWEGGIAGATTYFAQAHHLRAGETYQRVHRRTFPNAESRRRWLDKFLSNARRLAASKAAKGAV